MADISKQDAVSIFQKLLEKRKPIKADSIDQIGWRRSAKLAISRAFGDDSEHLKEFVRAMSIYSQTTLLESMLEEIQDYWPESESNTPQLEVKPIPQSAPLAQTPCVFIGHGRNPLWARLQIFLEHDLGLKTVNYESESRVGESIILILDQMLSQATFAVLILTAEDETSAGERRARQNVIHEVGLFQGKLGFKKVVLLIQKGIEEFSNVAGLQYISFANDEISQTFYELRKVLEREKQLVKA